MRQATQEWNGGVFIGVKKNQHKICSDMVLLVKTEMKIANLQELVKNLTIRLD